MYEFEGQLGEFMKRDFKNFEAMYPDSPAIETGLTRGINKMRQAVQAAGKELKLHNPDQKTRDILIAKLREATRADFMDMIDQERVTVEKQLSQQAESWTRDRQMNAAKYDAEVRKQSLRFKALDVDELRMEAERFMGNPRAIDPEALDALSIELKTADPAMHSQFRQFVRESHADEPWRYTDQGKQITKYASALDNASKVNAAPIVHEDGSIHFEALANVVGDL